MDADFDRLLAGVARTGGEGKGEPVVPCQDMAIYGPSRFDRIGPRPEDMGGHAPRTRARNAHHRDGPADRCDRSDDDIVMRHPPRVPGRSLTRPCPERRSIHVSTMESGPKLDRLDLRLEEGPVRIEATVLRTPTSSNSAWNSKSTKIALGV
jgi:hypothetical protein